MSAEHPSSRSKRLADACTCIGTKRTEYGGPVEFVEHPFAIVGWDTENGELRVWVQACAVCGKDVSDDLGLFA